MENRELTEKKELVVNSYKKTFDKDMSYKKAGVTEDERAVLDTDKEFQSRLELFLIEERERVIQNLRTFMDSDNEGLSYKATMDMAEVLYPDFFEAKKKDSIITVRVVKD